MNTQSDLPRLWLDRHVEQITESEEVSVEVFVRSLSPPLGVRGRQEALLRQLSELHSSGIVDSFDVDLWGNGVCLCDVCASEAVAKSTHDKVDEFEAWAAEAETVRLPFERRTRESLLAQTTVEDLQVPAICLGVYSDSALRGVFPCSVSGQHIPVTDYLAALSDQTATEIDPEAQHAVET